MSPLGLKDRQENQNESDQVAHDNFVPKTDGSHENVPGGLPAGEKAAFEQIVSGIRESNQNTASSASESLRDAEDRAATKDGLYTRSNSSGPNVPQMPGGLGRFQKMMASLRKGRGGVGIAFLLLMAGGGSAGIMIGPPSLLISLKENLVHFNDSAGPSMNKRVRGALRFKLDSSEKDPTGLCQTSKIKCRSGRLSNRAIDRLEEQTGAKAIGANGQAIDTESGKYPKGGVTHFEMDGRRIPANQFQDHLLKPENRRIGAKVFGRFGALNMRVMNWSGKHIYNKFFSKFKISKRSILNGKKTDVVKAIESDVKGKAASADKSTLSNAIDEKIGGKKGIIHKAKAGGVAYTTLVAGCAAVKAPGIATSFIAAAQLAQIITVTSSIVLTAADQAKASAFGSGFTTEDMDSVGTALTQKFPNEDGDLRSATDSKYLLAAMGINKGRPEMSQKFTPGYWFITSPIVQAARIVDDAFEPGCNKILSPAAMYSAIAVNAAVNVASASTGVGLIAVALNQIGSFAISEIASRAVSHFASEKIINVMKEIVEKSAVDQAQGEDLGDILGIGAAGFFSSGAMARHLPVLRESQVAAFNQMIEEEEQLQKEFDVASLSPFDTRSKHTFLGSIIHNANVAAIANGTHDRSLRSIAANLMRLPSFALNFKKANAASFSPNYCSYADEVMLGTDDDATPAMNMAGMPCTGMTEEHSKMGVSEAIDLLIGEGWLNESKMPDDDEQNPSIEELVESGVIKEDTPLHSYIQDCSNPDTGDYIINSASCTFDNQTASPDDIRIGEGLTYTEEMGDGAEVGRHVTHSAREEVGASDEVPSLKNPRSLIAIAIFLIDWQVGQLINGEDDMEGAGPSEVAGDVVDSPSRDGWSVPIDYTHMGILDYHAPNRLGLLHKAIDFMAPVGTPVRAAHDGKVVKIANSGCYKTVIMDAAGVSNIYHIYMHITPSVSAGDVVPRGGEIGKIMPIGGCGSGDHLHFGIETQPRTSSYADFGSRDTSLNPRNYLPEGCCR